MEVKNEEETRLHRVIAALQLSADQGWARYEEANKRAQHLEALVAAKSCQLADFSGVIKTAVAHMHTEYTEGRVPVEQREIYKQLMSKADDVLAMQDRKYIEVVQSIMGTHDELHKALPLIFRMMSAIRQAFFVLNEENVEFTAPGDVRMRVNHTFALLEDIIEDATKNEFVSDLCQFYELKRLKK